MYAVIMAGGRGSRFWPRSRKKTSKQILNIVGRHTMIQDTVARLMRSIPGERIFIITNSLLQREIQKQLPHIPAENVIAEPQSRSTAACVGLAAAHLLHRDPDAVMATFAADHLIRDIDAFHLDLKFAEQLAGDNDVLVTFGIPPAKPETGFGYIHAGEDFAPNGDAPEHKARRVTRFVEKPDMDTAEEFFHSPDYFVNSGMFVWKASVVMEEVCTHLPEMKQGLENIMAALDTPLEYKALGESFSRFPTISIDRGVMERTTRAVMVPARFDWNDLGSWSALYDVWPKDGDDNVCIGRKLTLDAHDILIYSPRKLVAAVGVSDLVIVDVEDALLVCHKDKAQDVSRLVDIMREKRMEEFL